MNNILFSKDINLLFKIDSIRILIHFYFLKIINF
jgi:hypothetical protein